MRKADHAFFPGHGGHGKRQIGIDYLLAVLV
jgi:hypothetical protein